MNARIQKFSLAGKGFLAVLLALFLGASSISRAAQSAPEPRREELLNGLRVMLWPQPGNSTVTLRMRIHSGAAFDLTGKHGTMALLGDALFPDPETREFFTEDLGGNLEVVTGYDAIEIKMTGRATEFVRMLEILRTALVSNQLANDSIVRLRDSRIKMVRELSIAPATIADRAIAKRLFGEYPYGRPAAGATDTLARVDRVDLLLARERFLSPDNSTIAIIGGVEERMAMRALKQLLGAWRRSDKRVPATFRQPEAADARTLLIDLPNTENVEIRLATRALSRSDKDNGAAMMLALLARDRWQAAFPELGKSPFFVRHESYLLSGMFVMGASVRAMEASRAIESARAVLRALTETPPTASEFERVRSEAAAMLNRRAVEPTALMELWLDAEAYKLDANTDQARALSKLTPADLQRVSTRLFREASFATVAVGSATQIKTDLERTGKVEILGDVSGVQPATATPAAKQP